MLWQRLADNCSTVLSLVAHSQTTSTRQPAARRAKMHRVSRSTLRSNLVRQNSVFEVGSLKNLQALCQCQKHPWTKIASFRPGKTMSGAPGKSVLCNLNRNPAANRALRTNISGLVSFTRIRAISKRQFIPTCPFAAEFCARTFHGSNRSMASSVMSPIFGNSWSSRIR